MAPGRQRWTPHSADADPQTSLDPGDTRRAHAQFGPARSPAMADEVMALQQAAGNRATTGLFEEPPRVWLVLQDELQTLMARLLELNGRGPVIGERTHLLAELHAIGAGIGAPGAMSFIQLADVKQRLMDFEQRLTDENLRTQEDWTVLDEAYRIERQRLSESAADSDRRAIGHLDASYDRAWHRIVVAGDLSQWYDISDLAQVLVTGRHIQAGFAESIDDALEADPTDGPLEGWPWPAFKATQLVVEGAAHGVHDMEHAAAGIRSAVDSAIRHQIQHGVFTMRQLGESEAAAAKWAADVYRRTGPVADEFVAQMTIGSRTAGKWAGRLHIAGKLTVYVDIGVSVIDIITASPEERPKKIVVHGSRIAGGLAGVSGGAQLGARFGSRLGPKGALVGGLVGGVIGGFIGAWTAKKVAAFVADEIWAPADTYFELVDR